jgi:hypothetical protein
MIEVGAHGPFVPVSGDCCKSWAPAAPPAGAEGRSSEREVVVASGIAGGVVLLPGAAQELDVVGDDLIAGGRLSFASAEDARTAASNVWATLDKVRDRVADMILIHGGDTKGLDRIAAAWAERRKVAQVAFGLDRRLGARAGFRRNEQMLSLSPRCLVAFAGNGVLERLVIAAKEKGVHVVDRRGPLGTNPKRSASS